MYMLGIRNVEYREKALFEMKRLLTSDGVLGIYMDYYLLYTVTLYTCIPCSYVYIIAHYICMHI